MPPSVASSVTRRFYEPRKDGNDPTRYYEVLSYGLENNFDDADGKEALRVLELLNTPAERDDCAKELARLKVLTKAAKQDGDDLMFQIAVMADELTAYPLDVVRDSCRAWAAGNKWFPGWADLRDCCEDRVLKRRCLLDALRRYFAASG